MHNSNKLYGPWFFAFGEEPGLFSSLPAPVSHWVESDCTLFCLTPPLQKQTATPTYGHACIIWLSSLFSGMIFIGFGKIIELLNYIKNK
jgi:hypothetical protein